MDLIERLRRIRAAGDAMTLLLPRLSRLSDELDQEAARRLVRDWDELWQESASAAVAPPEGRA